MTSPVNLFFAPDGQTVLRYWRKDGSVCERHTRFPAQLLTARPDPEADVRPCVLETPHAALFAAFRGIPLRPEADWRLAEGEAFGPVFREAFAALLSMLRRPPAERWCVRGEPGFFLQFGFREAGGYLMGALLLPCGKPAVLTFRAEDLIEAQPPPVPFAEMDVRSEADGLPPRMDAAVGWDTRLRLPIAAPGGALLRLIPHVPSPGD